MNANVWEIDLEQILDEIKAEIRDIGENDEFDLSETQLATLDNLNDARYHIEQALDFVDNTRAINDQEPLYRMHWEKGEPTKDGLYYIRTRTFDWMKGGDSYFYEISVVTYKNKLWGGAYDTDRIIRNAMIDWCPVQPMKRERKS